MHPNQAKILTFAWMADGACVDHDKDPDQWFPVHGGAKSAAALKVCATCPVQEECLDYALSLDMDTTFVNHVRGIWGGTTYAQRTRAHDERTERINQKPTSRTKDRKRKRKWADGRRSGTD